MNKYYSIVTPDVIGIFTSWNMAEPLVVGTKQAHHKSFLSYRDARQYVISKLSEMDLIDFGLDRNPIYLNKKFVRREQFIATQKTRIE